MKSTIFKEVVTGSQQETMNIGFVLFGTHQQDVHVASRKLMKFDGLEATPPYSTVRDFFTKLSGHRLTFCKTEMYL